MADDLPAGFSASPPPVADVPKPKLQGLDAIHGWFKDKGNFLSPHAADALASVSSAETGGDPYAANKAGSGALGGFQWLGSRKKDFIASGQYDPAGQAQFAMKELSSGRYPKSWAALNDPNASTNSIRATLIDEFEAPGGSAAKGYGPAGGDMQRAMAYKPPKPGDVQKSDLPPPARPAAAGMPPGFSAQPPSAGLPKGFSTQAPGPQDPSIMARTKPEPTLSQSADTLQKGVNFLLDKVPPKIMNLIAEKGGNIVESLLTPTGPLDPVNLIPNREALAKDLRAYLFEGGNVGGPGGTPGLERPAEAPKLAEAAPAANNVVTLKPWPRPMDASAPVKGEINYEVHQDGKPVGYVSGVIKGNRLTDFTVQNAEQDMGKSNMLGTATARQALRALQVEHPEIKQIEGERLTGGRAAAGQSGVKVKVPLKEPRAASAAAAATPLHEIAAQNIKAFEAANAEPGFRQKLKDASDYAKQYFDTSSQAKAIIQKNVGNMARMGAQAKEAMTKFGAFTRNLNPEEQISLLKWLQTPEKMKAKGFDLPPEAQEFANTFKDWMQKYKTKLEALPQTDQMNFRENFVTQLWRNPKDAMTAINDYGAKKGSNYFTKARVFEDYEAGIRAGKAPVTTDPMELFSRYIENASAKIASWESKNDARDRGLWVYRKPENAPEGWVPVKGERDAFGHEAYAPPGLATIFNNYGSIAAQWKIPGTNFDVLSAAQRAANATTGFKLSFSGFHAALETMESVFSGLADGITKIKNGNPIKGITALAKAPAKPFTSFINGRRAQHALLDGEFGSPEMQKIVQALTDANYDFMREGGLADEYRVSRMPGFIKGWQKGIPATTGGPLKMGIRAFETTMEPVFQYYVPWLKNQAAMDMMKTYLDAHPDLSAEDFAAYGRKVANIMDSRFGEMNKNNIFWPATAKKMAQTAAISWSFTLGQARQALGAAWDAARIPDKAISKARGTLPATEEIWTDRLSYAVAIGLGTSLIDSVYQYLKTGQPPQSAQDLLNPRTGGTDPSTGQPERATLPNFANSYRNLWEGGVGQEAYNKIAPLWQTLIAVGSNKDWAGHNVRDLDASATKQLEQLGEFAASNLGSPITYGTVTGAKAGTHISSVERMFGVKAASMRDTAPEQFGKTMSYVHAKEWFDKSKMDLNQRRYTQGLGPLRVPYRTQQKIIQYHMQHPDTDIMQGYGGTQ